MELKKKLEKQGQWLFRFRGQIPLVIFFLCIPAVYLSSHRITQSRTELIITAGALFISMIGMMIRFIAVGTSGEGTSGRNTKEQVAEELTTSGIYSIVRHPLYLGNYLMWLGILCFTYNLPLILIISLVYWVYYEKIMYAEEVFLEKKFVSSFTAWANRTPAVFPSFENFCKADNALSIKKILRQEYSGFLAIVFCYCFIDNMRFFIRTGSLHIERFSIIFLFFALVLTLTLRTLKYHTSVLKG